MTATPANINLTSSGNKTKVNKVSLKVSPNPSLRVAEASNIPHQALLCAEPFAILGADRIPPILTTSVTPNENTCFGPRGSALMAIDGPLWICDTGHHRLLGWKKMPTDDYTPADWVIGQKNFNSEGRNGKSDVSAYSVNVPTGICTCGDGMAVADAWNHRVLIWKTLPEGDNVPADIVLGQMDFESNEANHGKDRAAAHSMHWPYGVSWQDNHLFVADSENRRVLIWQGLPTANGQPADVVLGQHNFATRDENAGNDPSAMSMRWPHGIALWRGNLCVSDAGNNRVMIWQGIPDTNGMDCDYVLGQSAVDLVDHNQSLYWPRAYTLNMPYGLAVVGDWLLVADTASSRLLGWHFDDLATGADARALSGQMNFHDKGDNRWQPPCADSVCWPYGIQSLDDIIVVADSGNNRVSLWKLAV
jgi:NHL repeat-containing protein